MSITRLSDIGVDSFPNREFRSPIVLLASGAQIADGVTADIQSAEIERASKLIFEQDVSAASGTTPVLIVAIQYKIGNNYWSAVRWANATGVGKNNYGVDRNLATGLEFTVSADPVVGAGSNLIGAQFWGDTIRVKWTITGTTPSFTFAINCYPIR